MSNGSSFDFDQVFYQMRAIFVDYSRYAKINIQKNNSAGIWKNTTI